MNKLFICILLLGQSVNIYACDICGCNASSNYLGVLPKFRQNFIGIRGQSQYYQSLKHPQSDNTLSSGHESFLSSEIWGRAVINYKIQVFGFIPYKINKREEGQKITTVNGLGDMSLMVNYIMVNRDSSKYLFKQLLQFGGGIKLPTGKYDMLREGVLLNPNLQLGSGSFDFPLNLNYTLRYNKLGFNTDIGYTFNGVNNQEFQFGNRLNSGFKFFYWKRTPNFLILPAIGSVFELAKKDKSSNRIQDHTGGSILFFQSGLDLYYKKMAFGFIYRKPLTQNLNAGFVTSKPRVSATIIYLF
jgi:hypothetical protein